MRESPAEKIVELLHNGGAEVVVPRPSRRPSSTGCAPVDYAPESYDCVVIVTAHTSIDYADLVERADVVVDLRNATGSNGTGNGKVWKL